MTRRLSSDEEATIVKGLEALKNIAPNFLTLGCPQLVDAIEQECIGMAEMQEVAHMTKLCYVQGAFDVLGVVDGGAMGRLLGALQKGGSA